MSEERAIMELEAAGISLQEHKLLSEIIRLKAAIEERDAIIESKICVGCEQKDVNEALQNLFDVVLKWNAESAVHQVCNCKYCGILVRLADKIREKLL